MALSLTSRLSGLAAVIATGVLAVGAWLVPTSMLVLELPGQRAADAPPPEPPKPAEPAPLPTHDWTILAQKISPLREPWKAPTEEHPGEQAVAERPKLNWEYIGLLETSTGIHTAIVIMNGSTQRFINEGETVQDPASPGSNIRLVSITPEKIELQWGKEKTTIERKQATNPLLSSGAISGAQAGEGGILPSSMVQTPGSSSITPPSSPFGSNPNSPAGGRITQPPPGGPGAVHPGPQGARPQSPNAPQPAAPAAGQPNPLIPRAPAGNTKGISRSGRDAAKDKENPHRP